MEPMGDSRFMRGAVVLGSEVLRESRVLGDFYTADSRFPGSPGDAKP